MEHRRARRTQVPLAIGLTLMVGLACAQVGDTRDAEGLAMAREELVRRVEAQGVRDTRVLAALRAVPRHEFVPRAYRDHAYDNTPLPIGLRQTISQPYIVALMTQLLAPKPGDRVLEIGTGSGYQAAVLAVLKCEVYTIELLPELAERAAATLSRLGYAGIHPKTGDGYKGWPEEAPFDGVIVTAAPDTIPQALVDQLRPGGRLVIPVGPQGGTQVLKLLQKTAEGKLVERNVIPVRFVPMVPGSKTKSGG